jgi:hypothetical protein
VTGDLEKARAALKAGDVALAQTHAAIASAAALERQTAILEAVTDGYQRGRSVRIRKHGDR